MFGLFLFVVAVYFSINIFLIYNKNRLYIHMSGEEKGGGGMLVKMLFFIPRFRGGYSQK